MTQLISSMALVAALTLAAPAVAQEQADTQADTQAQTDGSDDGFSLMEQGARLFMQGILSEMEPALSDLAEMATEVEPRLREMLGEMGPAFFDIFGQVDDFANYDPPVFLPNGDIILRRKPDAPVWVAPEGVEVDL